MGNKATAVLVEQRQTAVMNLLIGGVSRSGILKYVANEGWGLSNSAVDWYISKATKAFKLAATIDRDEQVGLAIMRLHDLYKSAYTAGDYRTALHVQKEITAMLGLAEAAQINLNVDFGDFTDAMHEWQESIKRMGGPQSDHDDDDVIEAYQIESGENEE